MADSKEEVKIIRRALQLINQSALLIGHKTTMYAIERTFPYFAEWKAFISATVVG